MVTASSETRAAKGRRVEVREIPRELQGVIVDQQRTRGSTRYTIVLGTKTVRYSSRSYGGYTQAMSAFQREARAERVTTVVPPNERYAGVVGIEPLDNSRRVMISVPNGDTEDPQVVITLRTGVRRRIRDTQRISLAQLQAMWPEVDPTGGLEQGKLFDNADYRKLLTYLFEFQERQGEFAPN